MIFVEKDLDVFLFYHNKSPKPVYLNAEVLNKQLKDLINNDIIVNRNLKYLFEVLNNLYENRPLDKLKEIMLKYYENDYATDEEFKKLWLDFGTIKHWIGDRNDSE